MYQVLKKLNERAECFVNFDLDKLLSEMLKHMSKISEKVGELQRRNIKRYFKN